jgi:endoglucanase
MMKGGRALGAVLLVFLLVSGAGARVGVLRHEDGPGPARRALSPPSRVAVDGRRFLDTYVDPDGRVVRRDEGGDTVSEGQAYALLVAVALDDQATFDRVWTWTAANLGRPDGLLAWRWADGAVVDGEAAADADLDAAWALTIAARRWPFGGYGHPAQQLAAAIAAYETVAAGEGRTVLAAGPWAVRSTGPGGAATVNPGYASPVAEAVLAEAGYVDAAAATARAAGGRHVVTALLDERGAPTDWARVATDGTVSASGSAAGGSGGRFGWDAVRVPLRFAASCDPADQALAARVWQVMLDGAGVDVMGDHPARLTAAAAAAAAAGDDERAASLLDEASAQDEQHPTYYGSALTALARILLTTDDLGGCAPLDR